MKLQNIKRYAAYKDSGVEWFNAAPNHWPTLRLKDVIAKLESGVSVNASNVPIEGENIGVLRTSCVGKGTFLPSQNKSVWATEIKRVSVPVRAGRIIISRMNTPDLVGASAYIPKDYPNLFLPDRLWQTVFFANVKLDSKWLSWIMDCNAFRFLLSTLATGTSPSMKNLGQEKFYSIGLPFPFLSEQTAIADYLDTKTAQIDRQIDLLGQKATHYGKLKQSLINETVTRGLDKIVAMKDSGVEWLGEVPAHWDLKRIKEISEINQRTLSEKTPANYEFEYVDIGSVTYGVKGYEKERMTFDSAPSRAKRIVKKGDTIISTVRTYLKAIASIDEDVSDVIVSTGFAVISPKKQIVHKYCSYLLTSEFIIDEICALSTGVSYPATNATVIGDLLFLVPPIPEQTAIANYLDEKTAQIDSIIAALNAQTDKLRELRKTLINDVVTGKIKVVPEGGAA